MDVLSHAVGKWYVKWIVSLYARQSNWYCSLDGNNVKHLTEYGLLRTYMRLFYKHSLLSEALRPGWPRQSAGRALGLWIGWLGGGKSFSRHMTAIAWRFIFIFFKQTTSVRKVQLKLMNDFLFWSRTYSERIKWVSISFLDKAAWFWLPHF